jgi:hypothetical protein
MSVMHIDATGLNLPRLFDAVYRAHGVSKAAERCKKWSVAPALDETGA